MKKILLSTLAFLFIIALYAQDPPPCGIQGFPVCDNDGNGFGEFNLLTINPFCNEDSADYNLPTYHISEADAMAGVNQIANPNAYTNTIYPETIYIRVEPINLIDYIVFSQVELEVHALKENITDLEVCDMSFSEGEYYYPFDLGLEVDAFCSLYTFNGNYSITYFETEEDANSNVNAVIEPISSPSLYNGLFIRAENLITGFLEIKYFNIIQKSPPITILPLPMEIDEVDFDGTAEFDLTSNTIEFEPDGDVFESDYSYHYYLSEEDVFNYQNEILNPSAVVNTSNPQTIYVKIQNINYLYDCYAMTYFDLIVIDSGDDDNDGVINSDEDINGNGNLDDDDTDEDTIPDYMDEDDDGDNIDTADELVDQSSITRHANNFKIASSRIFIDTDLDMIENYIDDDDDGDGVLTKDEDYNNNGTPLDDDTNGNSIPDYLEKTVTLSVNNFELSSFSIFPNPAKNRVELKFNKRINNLMDISIYNILGKTVLNSKNELQTNAIKINVSALKSGIYFIKVNNGLSEITKKLIVN